jgi:hypothetical protein
MRTALELLPNLYFLRDMETVKDVNNDLMVWDRLKKRILDAADPEHREKLNDLIRTEEGQFSFKEGNKHVITPVIIAPDEELPVQDTEFVQPKLGKTFEMGREKAKEILSRLEKDNQPKKIVGPLPTLSVLS